MLLSCVIISPSVSSFDHTGIIVRTLPPAQPFLGSPAAMPYAAEAEAAYNYLRRCVKEALEVPRGVGGLLEKHVRLVARALLHRCTEHEVAAAAAQQRPSWCSRVAVLEEARLPAEACPLPRQGRALHKEGEVRLRMKNLWLTPTIAIGSLLQTSSELAALRIGRSAFSSCRSTATLKDPSYCYVCCSPLFLPLCC